MNTKNSEDTGRLDALYTSIDLTPEMINRIYREAHRLRAEAYHDAIIRACRAVRRATTAICRVLFTSEAHRHA
jgi:hypothetical protein